MTRMFTLAAVLLAVPAARAQVVASDGFAYTSGLSLNGQNGGSGWAGAWAVSGGTVVVQSGSLPPPAPSNGLAETGNSVSANGLVGTATRTLPALSAPGTAGTVFWISAVMHGPGTPSSSAAGTLTLTNAGGSDGFSIATGTSSTGNWAVTDPSTGGVLPPSATSSVSSSLQSLLVARATFGSTNDVYDLFINPPLTGNPPATPDATVSFTHATTTLNLVKITGFSFGSSPTFVDEIRLGTTFASVTPVPEPSALVLAGAAGLGLAVRRRRGSIT